MEMVIPFVQFWERGQPGTYVLAFIKYINCRLRM